MIRRAAVGRIVAALTVDIASCSATAGDGRAGDRAGRGTTRDEASTSCAPPPPPAAWTPAAVGAATFDVNRATRGMTSRVRWMLAPDSSALLVMDDPVAVEHDAIPNGLLLAMERSGRVFQMDSVWSAAPSPDWRRLAVGRGVVVRSRASQTITPDQWMAPAARLRARWIDGPTLEIGTPVSIAPPAPIAVRGRSIEQRDGRVVVRERTAAGRDSLRDVGPGTPLTATRSGRFVLAIAPRVGARPDESPDHAVVYRVP